MPVRRCTFGAIAILSLITVLSRSAAAQANAPCAGAEAGRPATPPATPGAVRIFLSSDADGTFIGSAVALGPGPRLRLPRFGRDFDFQAALCEASCSADAERTQNPYRVVGLDIAPSKAFDLPAAPGGLDVRVHTGSWAGHVWGSVLSLLGIGFSVAGAGELVAWDALGRPPVVNHTPGVLLPDGLLFVGLGVITGAIGVPLFFANRTTVDVTPHVPGP